MRSTSHRGKDDSGKGHSRASTTPGASNSRRKTISDTLTVDKKGTESTTMKSQGVVDFKQFLKNKKEAEAAAKQKGKKKGFSRSLSTPAIEKHPPKQKDRERTDKEKSYERKSERVKRVSHSLPLAGNSRNGPPAMDTIAEVRTPPSSPPELKKPTSDDKGATKTKTFAQLKAERQQVQIKAQAPTVCKNEIDFDSKHDNKRKEDVPLKATNDGSLALTPDGKPIHEDEAPPSPTQKRDPLMQEPTLSLSPRRDSKTRPATSTPSSSTPSSSTERQHIRKSLVGEATNIPSGTSKLPPRRLSTGSRRSSLSMNESARLSHMSSTSQGSSNDGYSIELEDLLNEIEFMTFEPELERFISGFFDPLSAIDGDIGKPAPAPIVAAGIDDPVTRNRKSSFDQDDSYIIPKDFGLGMKVTIDGKSEFVGTLKFLGVVKFADGMWGGVQLDLPCGKSDGSVQGVQYFRCDRAYGVFVKLERLAHFQHTE